MNHKSLMQTALGDQWERLPLALKTHYQPGTNVDDGRLDIEYPRPMQPYLSLLHRLGALIDRQGQEIPTRVEKRMRGETQFWRRTLSFPSGRTVTFNSFWRYEKDNELIEFVNPFMGLRMAVEVEDEVLRYSGRSLVLQLGRLRLSIPESLFLGNATIVERALNEHEFEMDFRLTHPWFGRVYRYTGRFTTLSDE